jgi:hypothetical protein
VGRVAGVGYFTKVDPGVRWDDDVDDDVDDEAAG